MATKYAVVFLAAASLGLLGLLLLKSIVDVDAHFDSWWYHLPWAARLVGLISPEAFQFEPIAAVRYQGFPLLPEFLQGVLWRVTGRVESANLVSMFGLLAFVWFLQHFFRIRFWLAVPALLAVPLIQGQATSTYVDLLANLAFAAFLLLIYLAYTRENAVNKKFFVVLVLSAFIAANSKLQLIPLIAVGTLFAALVLRKQLGRAIGFDGKPGMRSILVVICLSLVFFVPLKNLALHGNPFFPIKVEVLGHALNYAEVPPPKDLHAGELADASRVKKWFYSVFEIGMGPVIHVKRWSIDSAAPEGSPMGIQGGLFGYYVIFQLLLFGWLLVSGAARRSRVYPLAFIGLCVMGAALMPASHLVRYYMFWFICLISLNLHYLSSYSLTIRVGFSALFFAVVLIVVDASDQNFVRPKFKSLAELLEERVNPNILESARGKGNSCLALDRANEPFLYASFWHKDSHYIVKAGPFYSSDPVEIEKTCGNRDIIRSM